MSLTLKNPEKFNLKWATITGIGGRAILRFETRWMLDDFSASSERGAKQIFAREYGKGAIWEGQL